MRLFLLLVILGLVGFMSYEFNFFTQHYAYLEELNAKIMKDCNL